MAFTGRIEEIWAEAEGEHHTIYQAGWAGPQAVEIPEGAKWHLHVVTSADWPEQAMGWATAVTGKNGVTNMANARLHLVAAGGYEFEFDMGLMPSHTVNIGRIRFWKNRAYTNVPPPEEDR